MRDFKELNVWKDSHELCLLIYSKTNQFPDTEKFGITSQIRRASASVPTNISEGCGRDSNKEFARFLRIASGSISEVEYLVILSKDLNYLQEGEKEELLSRVIMVRKMLYKLIKAVV